MSGRTGVCAWRAGRRREFSCITNIEPTDVKKVRRIAEAIVRDENSVLPVSGLADGHYGLHDLCLGLPAIVGREGIKQILDFPLDEAEHRALEASAAALSDVLAEIEPN